MKQEEKPKKRRRLILIALLLALLGAALLYVLIYLSGRSAEAPTDLPAYKVVETDYYRTKVPRHFNVQTETNPKDSRMVELLANEPRENGKQVGIITNVLPPNGLAGVPDYAMRKSKPKVYDTPKESFVPAGGQLFHNTGEPNEYVLYLIQGDRFASVTVTGESSSDQRLRLLKQVVDDWEWKNLGKINP